MKGTDDMITQKQDEQVLISREAWQWTNQSLREAQQEVARLNRQLEVLDPGKIDLADDLLELVATFNRCNGDGEAT